MSKSRLLCRFCADEKPYAELKILTTQDDRRSLIEKLLHFGIDFVDFSNKMLPETVCIICYEHINVSHEFFLKVKRSQMILSELCAVKVDTEIGLKFSNYAAVKEESVCDGEYLQDYLLSNLEDAESLVKDEKFESGETTLFQKDEDRTMDPTSKIVDKDGPTLSKLSRRPKKRAWASYPWQCAVCGLRETTLTALRRHCQTVHHKCFAFKCADCVEKSDDFNGFVAHVRQHRKVLRNYCEHCNIKMENTHQHIMDNHCTQCGDRFEDPASLHIHTEAFATGITMEADLKSPRSWEEYPAICRFCNLRAVNRNVLSKHCVTAHRKCFGSQCVDCGVNVDCFKDFVKHVVKHRPHLSNICPYCNKDIEQTPHHIEDHTANLHPCNVCGKIFPRKKRLRRHESTIDPSPLITPPRKRRKGPLTTKDTTCTVCGVVRKTPSSLWAHLKTHTDRKRNYTCERCGKAFYTKGCLVAHHKIHENIVKEACKICQKSFLTIARLKKHVKTHNLEMPFQCEHCKRFYNSKERLREHVKVHMSVMPFQCQYCPKKFRHKTIMKTHENQHTGARPYSCNLCCMEFTNWSNCNKHMKRKHGTTLAKNVMTPHGKLALNPRTGKPDQLFLDNVVKEWSEKLLMSKRERGQICLGPQMDCIES